MKLFRAPLAKCAEEVLRIHRPCIGLDFMHRMVGSDNFFGGMTIRR
jgi:hypothetical protein